MRIDWRAVGLGFVVTLLVGLVAGFSVPAAAITLSGVGWAVAGVLGGTAAGYVVGTDTTAGAVHGLLAATLAAIGVLVALGGVGAPLVEAGGLESLPVSLLLFGLYAIPGAVGGWIGAMLKRSSEGIDEVKIGRPAGR